MKTDDLIGALAADSAAKEMSHTRALLIALGAGALIAALHFFMVWGLRADLSYAFTKPEFLFKFAIVTALAASSIAVVMRLVQPGAKLGLAGVALALVPVALAAGVGYEMMTVPQKFWADNWAGMNVDKCLTVIPMLSLVPVGIFLWALRHGAPTRPYLTGAVAGLASAGISAMLYATYCTSDSAMFVATWYPIAVGIVAAGASIIGGRLLRW
jgi:hypothetical protein